MLTLADYAKAIERDRGAVEKAKGLSAAGEIETKDLNTATTALRSQFENLGATLGSNVTPALADFSNMLAKRVGEYAESIRDNPRAQTRTMIGGGLTALGLGGLGVSGVSGLFSGAGVFGGMGADIAALPATTPIFVGATGAAAAYKGFEAFRSVKGADEIAPSGWLERGAHKVDQSLGLAPPAQSPKSWHDVAAGLRAGGKIGEFHEDALEGTQPSISAGSGEQATNE